MEQTSIQVNGLNELDNAAIKLLDFSDGHHFFIFEGDMGAGKTTLIKSLAKALGVTDVVSSPTFSIVNEYPAKDRTIYHFDFYRIKSISEAYDIGYEDYFYSGQYCFVEWPVKIEELLPDRYVKISISSSGEDTRLLSVSRIENSSPRFS